MKKLKIVVCLILIVTLIFSGSFGAFASDYGSYFDSMLKFVQGMYYQGLTDEEGIKAALKGLFSGLDKYSAFYDKEESETLNSTLNNSFVGIGAGLEKVDKGVKINKVYEDSPAENAGLLEGDIIVSVDGVSIVGKEAEEVASIIRGKEGTIVGLTILRNNNTMDFAVKRGKVYINPIQYRIEDDLAYIRIESFSSGASKGFNKAISEVNKNNILKIILDLRGNPGGYVDEAVNIARKLLPPGVVTTLDYKSEELQDQVYYSHNDNPKYIIAVLVDENSASASEILAGALQDAGNSILVGTNTYGKGVFQNLFTILTPEAYAKYSEQYNMDFVTDIQWMRHYGIILSEDEILGTAKITTGHYLTRRGRMINGVGLAPNVFESYRVKPYGVDLSLTGYVTNSAPMGLNEYGEDVYDLERILKAAGYFEQSADKQYDSATFDAVSKYQADVGLPVTGVVDEVTRDHLNKALNELRDAYDKQYSKANQLLGFF